MFDRVRLGLSVPTMLRRGAWGVAIGLMLEVFACSIGLIGLVQGAGWWWALVAVAGLLLALPAALRSVGVPPWLATVVDLLAFVALIDGVFAPRRSLFGVIPDRASIEGLGALFSQALVAIQAQRVPAEPLPELIFFIALFGGALAILLDLIAVVLRLPAVTALVLGGVLIVPAVLQPSGLSLFALGAGAGAWFVVLAADGRLRFGTRGNGALALATGASVTLLSLIVAATAPGFTELGRPEGSAPVSVGNTVNPLINLGADLRQPAPVDVLRYTSDDKDPLYLQLTTLDQMDGADWTHTPGTIAPLKSDRLPTAPGLSAAAGISARAYTTTVEVQSLGSIWLPTPYPSTQISGARSVQDFQANDMTVFVQGGELAGENYTVRSLDLQPTQAQLQNERFPAPAQFAPVSADLDLPPAIPAIITNTAKQIKSQAGGTSEIDIAVAIQNFFQSSLNGFTYSTSTPDSQDGGSLAIIAKFLKVREGYCVHFASAMAIIARILGIPSRIAIGYLPGSPIGSSGADVTYQVTSNELHAWPQLYFPGVGWLNFEPTVGRGAPADYTLPPSSLGGLTSAPTTNSVPDTSRSTTPHARALPSQQAASAGQATPGSNGVPRDLGLLLVLAALAAPGLGRAARRHGRISRLREDGHPPSLAWDEVRDTARDLGFTVSANETPRAFAARLRASWHPDAATRQDFDDILEQLELSVYGPPRPWERFFELGDKTAAVTAAMRASQPFPVRVLALVAPRSLLASGERRRALT